VANIVMSPSRYLGIGLDDIAGPGGHNIEELVDKVLLGHIPVWLNLPTREREPRP